jgi:hypothetical protein
MKFSAIPGLTLLLLILGPFSLKAQVNVRDSALSMSMIYATYGFSKPGGDLADRYGYSHQIGGGYMFKWKSGWSISAEGNFIFRDGVKNQTEVLSGISTSDGFIIDEAGFFANVMLLERGYSLWAKAGKLVPFFGPNPNSGLLFQLGGGMLQHKIRIQDPNNSAPQLKGEYKKGYDKMCNGPAISEYIGYQFMGNQRTINFFAGIEFVQAFTSSRRAYYFNEMIRPDEKRIDLLPTLKVGWYLPLYKKSSQKFFYY